MKDKFFKFLKDYHAYSVWLRVTIRSRGNADNFIDSTAPLRWISSAFTWNDDNESCLDWSDLNSKWKQYID